MAPRTLLLALALLGIAFFQSFCAQRANTWQIVGETGCSAQQVRSCWRSSQSIANPRNTDSSSSECAACDQLNEMLTVTAPQTESKVYIVDKAQGNAAQVMGLGERCTLRFVVSCTPSGDRS